MNLCEMYKNYKYKLDVSTKNIFFKIRQTKINFAFFCTLYSITLASRRFKTDIHKSLSLKKIIKNILKKLKLNS